jgi:serine protease
MLIKSRGELVMAMMPGFGNVGKACIFIALGLVLVGCDGGSGGVAPSASVALSGTIDIEAGTRVDADNADALLVRAPLIAAQSLPPEFILAGYVSDTTVTSSYPVTEQSPLQFNYFPDSRDVFTAPLQSGFEITLQSFATRLSEVSNVSPTVSELRLTITDSNGSEVGTAVAPSDGRPVTLVIDGNQNGEYRISVEGLDAAPMLYVLSSSRTETSGATAFDWPRHKFVQDEAIVFLRDPGKAGARANGLPTSALMVPGLQIAPGLWAVRRPSTVSGLGQGSPAEQTLVWIRQLNNDPAILHASPNYKTRALSPVDEPLYLRSVLGQQWHYSLINGPTAWQLAPGGGERENGDGVNVAVLDTGLFQSGGQWHPDLTANIIMGFDAVDGDAVPADPGNAVGGSVYHGTHVAGIIAAAVNDKGGAGVAFNSDLMPVRVLGEGGSGTLEDLLEAMQWVLGDSSLPRPPAEIVNLSLGGLPCGAGNVANTLQQLINQGAAQGIIYVAAAGNSATNQPSCPAALDNVFSVSAVDGAGNLSSYSNFGPTIDLAAPGGDASRDGNGDGQGDLISSTSAAFVDGRLQAVYRGLQGTSMAAPHVSGVLALMKAVNPTLTSGDIEGYLMEGELTILPCAPGCNRTDQLGYGVLDAAKAVQAVLSGAPPQLLTSAPAVLSLTTEANVSVSRTLELSPLGSYSVSITDVSVSDDWFTVSPFPTDPFSNNTPASLELTLVPENLQAGVSSRGSLVVTYQPDSGAQKTLTVPVIGQKITDQEARNAGRHFVLLVEPDPSGDTFETVGQAIVTASNGQYQFEFIPDDGEEPQLLNEVPPGVYFLVAGTDLDNDGLICHAGEACAEYPVAGLRQLIEVRENQVVTGLRMTTSYSRPTLSAGSPDLFPRPDFKGYRLMLRPTGNQSTNVKAIKSP